MKPVRAIAIALALAALPAAPTLADACGAVYVPDPVYSATYAFLTKAGIPDAFYRTHFVDLARGAAVVEIRWAPARSTKRTRAQLIFLRRASPSSPWSVGELSVAWTVVPDEAGARA